MSSKFKVGDKVVATKLATEQYGITKEGYTSFVIGFQVYADVEYFLIQRTDRKGMGHFLVEEKYFNHCHVKDTKIARAFYKNNIDRIEKGLIYLK